LVALESPTTDKDAVDRLGRRLGEELRALGATLTVDEQETAGNHLIARWAPAPTLPRSRAARGRAGEGILLLCHMDTVWDVGTCAQRPCRTEEGRLYGPGAYDMKAGIVITLAAMAGLRALDRRPPLPIALLVTSDEERGSRTSRDLIEREAARSRIVLCLEPALSTGALKTFRKGTGLYHVTVLGRAAHAGADHENGVNAIEELALQIITLQRLTAYHRGTTVNVGLVAGGTRTNVVPEHAECWVDLRVTTREEGDRMHARLLDLRPHLPGAQVTVTGGLNRPPMERDARMLATFAHACAVAAAHGIDLTQGESGGGSDANFTAALGVPSLDGLGAVGNGAHATDEHVVLSSLPERAALLAALILDEWAIE
jgi:glutamate carboxypeptidase